MSLPSQIHPLCEADVNWLRENLDLAKDFVKRHAPESATDAISVEVLDIAYANWFHQLDREKEDPNPTINIVGLAFGQLLADQANLDWVAVADDNRTEIALHGQPGDILIFPPNFIAKRYLNGRTGFLTAIFPEMLKDIARFRAANTPRPWWKFWSKCNTVQLVVTH